MQECVILAIDNGYDDTKVKTNEKIYKFKSKIKKTNGNFQDNNIIEYEGEAYNVGDGTNDFFNDKTQGITHKLCVMRALAENIKEDISVNLLLDLPLIHYFNKDFRDEFHDYMSKLDDFKYNKIDKKIKINNCLVIPQGLSALYAYDISQYENKMLGIIDIGGKTIDGCIIDNLHPLKESMFTINLGTKILENKVKTALNQRFLLNIQDYQVPYILKNEETSEFKYTIEEVFQEYFNEILQEIIQKNWSVETTDILGIGGGCLLVKDRVDFYLPKFSITNNPVYDNVIGLYNIGRELYEKEY